MLGAPGEGGRSAVLDISALRLHTEQCSIGAGGYSFCADRQPSLKGSAGQHLRESTVS